jgi:hypothetical protein
MKGYYSTEKNQQYSEAVSRHTLTFAKEFVVGSILFRQEDSPKHQKDL